MRRIAELDGLRGVAAMLIVAYHLFMKQLPGCWAAVDVFFVLSGYLITDIVLRHEASWRFLAAFYARRGLRIWPIYYLLIAILVVVSGWDVEWSALPYYLAYAQQVPHYWGGEMPDWPLMRHTWTLALEEQFYLIWPALVLLGGRRWTGTLALALTIASVEARMAGIDCWVLASRCDGFALGGLLAALLAGPDAARGRRWARNGAVVFGALAVLLWAVLGVTGRLWVSGGTVTTPIRVTIASLGSFALVTGVVLRAGHPLLAPLRTRPLVYLGTISYGIYLYHHPIVQSSAALGEFLHLGPGPALWMTELALTLVVAVASWHLVERPILRLKDRVPYQSKAKAVEATPPRPPVRGDGPAANLPAFGRTTPVRENASA